MSTGRGTPSDWVSGERVFAPPRGTVDVDWLVPAVLELVPGCSPGQAREALETAWRRRRGPAPVDGHQVPEGSAQGPTGDTSGVDDAAARVLDEALDTFGD